MDNRLIIRISKTSMAFAVADPTAENQTLYEPFLTKSGISTAANLREAFRSADLLNRGYQRALLVVDTPTLLVPLQELDEDALTTLYHHTFTGYETCAIHHQVLPNLNAVVAFAVNRDLQLVVADHFADVRLAHVMQPIWAHMVSRSYIGTRRKLYAYFHDNKFDVFAFDKNRFRFSNRFDATTVNDAAYHLLHVWKTLGMDPKEDELHLAYAVSQPPTVDEQSQRQLTLDMLHRYVAKAYTINPTAELNRARITQVKGLPFDLMLAIQKN